MTELTAREKITKYCEVKREPGKTGDLLLYGSHKYRMNKTLDKMSDADCDRVLKIMELDAHIVKQVAKGEARTAGRKVTARPEAKPCECGCGAAAGRGSKFRPGHDMKLKSKLRLGAASGNAGAKKELKARGWA